MVKVKHCRLRGKKYQIRICCGRDWQGKQIMKTMMWEPEPGMTDKQITKELERQVFLFEEKIRQGRVANSDQNPRFQEFGDQWFEEYAALNLRHTSYERMMSVSSRVYERFGNKRLDSITSRDIQRFINDLMLNGKNKVTGKPLSRKSVIHHLNLLSDIFNYAVQMEVLNRNPCTNVKVPKGEKKEKQIYTLEEVEQILTYLNQEPLMFRTFFTLELNTGLRRGEMLGLEWKDLDWDQGIISVRRTSNYTPSEGLYTDTTKTPKSQRSLKLPDLVMDLLRELKAKQEHDRIEIGSKWVETDRVFTKWNGEAMFVSQPYGWFKRFCKRHDMRFCDIHSMRHFFASILINEGIDVATVSALLGHADTSTTLSIYCHAFMQAQAKAIEVVANALNFKKEA